MSLFIVLGGLQNLSHLIFANCHRLSLSIFSKDAPNSSYKNNIFATLVVIITGTFRMEDCFMYTMNYNFSKNYPIKSSYVHY